MSNPTANYRINRMAAGKERAALARHRGEQGPQHKSWGRKHTPISEQRTKDCFDIWLDEVRLTVEEIRREYVPPHVRQARADFADEVPF